MGTVKKDKVEKEPAIRNELPDYSFIEKEWTTLPTEKIARKMNVYRMRPAHPKFDWFEHDKRNELMLYDSGERFVQLDEDGRGRWYYKNGRVSLDYYNCEDLNANQRFVIFSNGEPDERGRSRPYTVLAMFDYSGNGVVFDHAGKIRLKYNQTEGILLDRNIGPVTQWIWHSLNDPPILQQVMIDTQMPREDPTMYTFDDHHNLPDTQEMLAGYSEYITKDKNKKMAERTKPFQLEMKELKINEQFSLRILDQANIHLIYREGKNNLKINIGMILDHKEVVDIVDTDVAKVDEIVNNGLNTDIANFGMLSNDLDQCPGHTYGDDDIQGSITNASLFDKVGNDNERRLRHPHSTASVNRQNSAAHVLRQPLCTVATCSKSSTPNENKHCKCTRKPTCDVYYDTRLF